MPLKPRAPVFAAELHDGPGSATLIVAAPAARTPQYDALAADVGFNVMDPSSTAPVLPRVAPFQRANDFHTHTPTGPVMLNDFHTHTPTGPVMLNDFYPRAASDFYGFAPRPSEPAILPRMVTDAELLGRRPSVARRVARRFVSFVAFSAVLAVALVLAFAWTFKVPVNRATASTLTYEKVVAFTQVGPIEPDPIIVAPLAVQPHGPVTVPAATTRGGSARSGTVASNRL